VENVLRLVPLDGEGLLLLVAVLDLVHELAGLVSSGQHLVREKRLQLDCDAGPAAPDDAGVSIALQDAMARQRLAEAHRRHLVVRRLLQRLVHRVFDREIFSLRVRLQHDQRDEADRLADDLVAGPHDRVIECRRKADSFS
jgi:hypothetical protein